jgi:hypothetical protein
MCPHGRRIDAGGNTTPSFGSPIKQEDPPNLSI